MRGFRNIVFAGAAMAAFSITALPVQAAGAEWDHNSSVMKLIENGKKRRFVYEQPREALKPAGVATGTILFDGEEKEGGRLSGYAKLFRKGCDPIDYFVEGTFDRKKGEVLLQGQVPIYSGEGCKITGYSDSGNASKLHFTRLSGGDDRVAAIPDKEERPGYLPPAEVIGEPAVKKREPVARAEPEGDAERDLGERPEPRQRSLSRVEEEPLEEPEAFDEPESVEDEPVYRDYNWRKRRAERDRRYAEEDAGYFAEDEDDEDDAEYYEDDYDDYEDGPAYYPERLR